MVQPIATAAGDVSSHEREEHRRWTIDERDPYVAVQMPAFQDAIPTERRQVYTPQGFRHNPAYVPSNRSTERVDRHRMTGTHRDVIPDKFCGKIPWADYRRHFDVCRRLNGWGDIEAGQFLATRLQGAALKVLNNIPYGQVLTYSELTSRLEKRFGPGDQAENFLLELRTRRRQPRETLQELGQTIRELTSLAYPELSSDARERLARGHFSDAIEDGEIRSGIFRAHAATLDDAIRAGLEVESFLKAERARERSRPSRAIRAVENSGESAPVDKKTRQDIDELKANFKEIMNMMKEMKTMPERRETQGIRCYNCNEPGHIVRNCPNPRQGNGGRPSQRIGGWSNRQGPQM